jgi:hypothetical protein
MTRPLRRGDCPACSIPRTVRPTDEGIGAYEYWGSREVHHDWRYLCPECDAELINLEPAEDSFSNEDSYHE